MLPNCEPASEQCIIIDGVKFLNNADIDGYNLPPSGAPNIMMAAGGTQLKNILQDNVILFWNFHVDWVNPANTRVDGPQRLPPAFSAHRTILRSACSKHVNLGETCGR